MASEQLSKWLLAVSTQINRVLKLMPPLAWERNVNMLLDQYGGDGLIQMADTMSGVANAGKIRLMVEQYPDWANQLANEDGQEAIRSWVSTSKLAPMLNQLRLVAAWLMPAHDEAADSQLQWQIEDAPNNGGIYRILLEGDHE